MHLMLVSVAFSLLALFMFLYTAFGDVEADLKVQSIYWFFVSFVAVLIPRIKELRYKDLEVTFREEVKQLEERVTERIEKLDQDLFDALQRVRRDEASLSPEQRQRRDSVFMGYAAEFQNLPPAERLRRQAAASALNLGELGWDVRRLREALKAADYQVESMDDRYTAELAEEVGRFQSDNDLNPVDGIFGRLTYAKLAERLGF